MCEFWWEDLTTCYVSTSQEVVICPIHAKGMIRLSDDVLEIHVRCGGRSRQLCVKNQNDVP